MDSPIDPVNKGSEYVGLPKVDPWHESEKHKKKRFAKMLEDRLEDQNDNDKEEDAVELTGTGTEAEHVPEDAPESPIRKSRDDGTDNSAPQPPAHIDVKG